MANDSSNSEGKYGYNPIKEGYQPTTVKRGYQPSSGNLDPSNPPGGGQDSAGTSSTDSGSNQSDSSQSES